MREVVFFQLVERYCTAVTELSFPLPSGKCFWERGFKEICFCTQTCKPFASRGAIQVSNRECILDVMKVCKFVACKILENYLKVILRSGGE